MAILHKIMAAIVATLHKTATRVTETAILHTIPVAHIHLSSNLHLDFLSLNSSLVDIFLILTP